MHDGISGSFRFNDKSGIFTFLSPMFSDSFLGSETNTPKEQESMGVFLFYIASFSNNAAWLILEIIWLGDLLVDLFTEQERMMCARAYHKVMAKFTALPLFPFHKLTSCSLYLPSNR